MFKKRSRVLEVARVLEVTETSEIVCYKIMEKYEFHISFKSLTDIELNYFELDYICTSNSRAKESIPGKSNYIFIISINI